MEPLREQNFLSADEMMAVFGNIQEMVTVQRKFLRSLEASIESDTATPLESIAHPSEFKVRRYTIPFVTRNRFSSPVFTVTEFLESGYTQ